MGNKALIVTHPHDYFASYSKVKRNIESFIREHAEYDLIKVLDSEMDDSLDFSGEAIFSDDGYIDNDAARIISAYDTIVTAGGYFDLCALGTFKSIIKEYFHGNRDKLRLAIPLDLNYRDPPIHPGNNFLKDIFYLRGLFVFHKLGLKLCADADLEEFISENMYCLRSKGIAVDGLASCRQLNGAND